VRLGLHPAPIAHQRGGLLECPRRLDGYAAAAGDEAGLLGEELHVETGPAEHLIRAGDIENVDAVIYGNANQHDTNPPCPDAAAVRCAAVR
jgi:hypothetical protein